MVDVPLEELAADVQRVCVAVGLTVGTVESCTGGLIGHLITEVAGSSAYFRGGLIAYSDDVKVRRIGVDPALIAAHGAVSAQVARAMAVGARDRLSVDLAVATTGIAGPGGGSAAKPVGLTYVAVAGPRGITVGRFVWPHDRSGNKVATARMALAMLLEAARAHGGAGQDPARPGTDGGP